MSALEEFDPDEERERELERKFEYDRDVEETEFEMCPQGCGRTTEDPYGGPCKACWDKV